MAETTLRDRRATPRELEAFRNWVLSPRGPGIAQAAVTLGTDMGWLSRAMRGLAPRRPLMLSQLRLVRAAAEGDNGG